ncbi:hypothetical protein [Leisingera sp. ANG59]|uniref:hypothetical protein n=1 Tax=Leisingera sp. ANG59 TaxID=2675221 RepID=UPI0015723586|nr:hypothetical protein [Leisingera sp. ANG59]NSY39287.1 hypothetical protein [Leisingera sp. ANG59]
MFDVILAIIAASAQPGTDAGTPEAAAAAPAPAAVPAALAAEPQEATGRFTTALEVKPILAATQANWIHVREFDGQDLLYVTHLWSWRCGLAQVRLGVNGQAPEIWPLPDCHLEEGFPNMIKEEDGLPYRSYPLGSIEQIAVEVTYDDLSTESLTFSRSGRPLQ